MTDSTRLSLAEWIVLALVDEQPRHGFAITALTGEAGEVGRAWQVPKPIVYRAAARLGDVGLVEVHSTELGGRGPQRSVLSATTTGSSATENWLGRPVDHVREGRSELLVKLCLLTRRDLPTGPLLTAQRAVFERIEAALVRQQKAESGFDRVLATWRTENVRGALRFIDALD